MKRLLLTCVTALSLVTPASASFLDDVWGVVTDPFKVGAGTQNIVHAIERSAIHIERIEGNINNHLRDRIDQFEGVIETARSAIDQSTDNVFRNLNQSFEKVEAMQKQLYLDTAELIKCSTEVTLNQIQTTLARSLNDLSKRNPSIEVFGKTIVKAKIKEQDIQSPIKYFREIKRLYDAELATVSLDDHPSSITDIYAEIQRLSDLTRCHYDPRSQTAIDLYEYQLEHIRLQKYWTNVKPI